MLVALLLCVVNLARELPRRHVVAAFLLTAVAAAAQNGALELVGVSSDLLRKGVPHKTVRHKDANEHLDEYRSGLGRRWGLGCPYDLDNLCGITHMDEDAVGPDHYRR